MTSEEKTVPLRVEDTQKTFWIDLNELQVQGSDREVSK